MAEEMDILTENVSPTKHVIEVYYKTYKSVLFINYKMKQREICYYSRCCDISQMRLFLTGNIFFTSEVFRVPSTADCWVISANVYHSSTYLQPEQRSPQHK